MSKSIRIKDGKKQILKDSNNLEVAYLVSDLVERKGEEFDKVVGITAYCLNSGEGNWSLRGITFKGPTDTCAFVSTYLIKQQSHTKHEFEFRLAKVALHELGHSLDLPHCGTTNIKPSLAYSDQRTIVEAGNVTCFMLEGTADGQQFYATSNRMCAQCKALIKSSIKN